MPTLLNRCQAPLAMALAQRASSVSHALRRPSTRLHMPPGEPPWVEDPSPTPQGPKPPPEMPPGRSPDVIEPPVPTEQPPIQEPPLWPDEIVVVAFGVRRLMCAVKTRDHSPVQLTGHAACHTRALLPHRAQFLRNNPSTTFRTLT